MSFESLLKRRTPSGGESPGCTERGSIWTVGGGKGGTGKSFVAANLALLLAEREQEVNLIDADLGTPNLHTFLGIEEPTRTLGEFIYKKVPNLTDVLIDTETPRLHLVAGSHDHLYLANLHYAQKLKLLRHIRSLDRGRTVIDIGGGTGFNSLDFFPIADLAILVINPDPASIENAYQFLRSLTLRMLKLSISGHDIADLVRRVSAQPAQGRSIESLLKLIAEQDREASEFLAERLARFRACLIVNRGGSNDDIVLGRSIVEVVRKYLALDLEFLGAIPHDPAVAKSLRSFQPYVQHHPASRTSCALRVVLDRLLELDRASAQTSATKGDRSSEAGSETVSRTDMKISEAKV